MFVCVFVRLLGQRSAVERLHSVPLRLVFHILCGEMVYTVDLLLLPVCNCLSASSETLEASLVV